MRTSQDNSGPMLQPRPLLAPSRLRPDAVFRAGAAPRLRSWMLHDGSLTDRLARAFGAVQVTPTHQGLGHPSATEAALLRARSAGGWWIREISLAAGGVPRLRARTLVPPTAPRLMTRLRGLGATPLGRVLFRRDRPRPEVQRAQRLFGRSADGAWLRLTCYTVHGEPLLVVERLLPATLAEAPPGSGP